MAKKKASKLSSTQIIEDIANQNVMNQGVEFVRTGFPLLDIFVVGEKKYSKEIEDTIGFPKGKLISISGDQGVGKSTLMLELSKGWCKNGYRVLYIDAEGGLNIKSMTDYGVLEYAAFSPEIEDETSQEAIKKMKIQDINDYTGNKKSFLALRTRTYNKTINIIRQIVKLCVDKKNPIDFIIIDSIKDLSPTAVLSESNGDDEIIDVEKQQMMIDAKSQEYFLMALKDLCMFNRICGILLNQMRIKTRGMFYVLSEAGGQAYKHRMDIRIIVKENSKIMKKVSINNEDVDRQIGNKMQLYIEKGRFGNSKIWIILPLIFGKGISSIQLALDILTQFGYIKKNGTWYTFKVPELKIDEKYQGEPKGRLVVKKNIVEINQFILDNNMIVIEEDIEEPGESEESEELEEKNDIISEIYGKKMV